MLRYPQKTVNLGLQFSAGEGNTVVEAYSDADFANALSLKSVPSNMLMNQFLGGGLLSIWLSCHRCTNLQTQQHRPRRP